jgi:hypothetical protein
MWSTQAKKCMDHRKGSTSKQMAVLRHAVHAVQAQPPSPLACARAPDLYICMDRMDHVDRLLRIKAFSRSMHLGAARIRLDRG